MLNHPKEAPEKKVKQIAIFASGTGSNAEKIIEYFASSTQVKVGLIVSNRADAGVVTIGHDNKIPVLIIEKEKFCNGDAYVDTLFNTGIDFIVLAGFLWKVPAPLLKLYHKRIVNIHPALLPKYGGHGMYGTRVHDAVIQSGDKESGITIHYVDEHYDNGDIIFQAKCAVDENETAESLAAKVHKLEHEHYPSIVERCLQDLWER